MGRRSRKRPSRGAEREAERGAERAAERAFVPSRDPDERPKAPWHPFPLVELCALLGIVLLVLGLLDLGSDRGRILLVAGMVIGSLAGLETSLREHFAGFRSHTTVLAGIPGVGAAAALYFARAPWPLVIVGAIAAFAAGFLPLQRAYRRRER
jgi:hypothetical protein